MNYGSIKPLDIANGEGVRVSLFVSGCSHHCKDCFNPETWDFGYGQEYTQETEDRIIGLLEPAHVNGLSLLGGDPMEIPNQRVLVKLLERVRAERPGKNVWCYTGCVMDRDLVEGGKYHCEVTDRMLELIDVLVDGPFIAERKDITLRFRGSSNQRLLDLDETRQKGSLVLWDEEAHW